MKYFAALLYVLGSAPSFSAWPSVTNKLSASMLTQAITTGSCVWDTILVAGSHCTLPDATLARVPCESSSENRLVHIPFAWPMGGWLVAHCFFGHSFRLRSSVQFGADSNYLFGHVFVINVACQSGGSRCLNHLRHVNVPHAAACAMGHFMLALCRHPLPPLV